VARLADHDVPFAPINDIETVVADPQVQHLGLIVPLDGRQQGGHFAVRPAVQFDGEHADRVSAAPQLDQHGAAIRKALEHADAWPAPGSSVPARPVAVAGP